MVYMSDTFLPASTAEENFLKIRDDSGSIRYKIYNNTVSSVIATSNNVLIKTDSDSRTLKLPFKTQTEAQVALVKLKSALKGIKSNLEATKESVFQASSFELKNDDKTVGLKFDLENFVSKSLKIGQGELLITEKELQNEINESSNDYDRFHFFEHFLTASYNMITGSYSNAGFRVMPMPGRKGVLEMNLGNTVTDAYVWSGSNCFDLKNKILFEADFLPPTSLEDNSFKIMVGFFNNTSLSNSTRNAGFYYDHGLNNNWLIKAQDSTQTLQNTLVPYRNEWFKMKIESFENELQFFINDELVGTLYDNVPQNEGSEVGFGITIELIESNQTNRFYVDSIKCKGLL